MKTGARALIFLTTLLTITTAHAKIPRIDGMSSVTHAHAEQALACSQKLGRNPDLLIVADMRLGSGDKRLWAIDTKTGKTIVNTEVAHGRGSDPGSKGRAQVFSNTPGSLMTSVGLYSIAEAYKGKDGHITTRRRLDGLMPGFNDNARERAVVLHPARYVRDGWAGHSEGCPAVSYAVMEQLNDRGLDNAVLWIEGDVEGLSEAVATCSGTNIRKRFRWPWQKKLPAQPEWSPESTEAFNPYFQVEYDNFCPTPEMTASLSWWSGQPIYAEAAGQRWTLRF